MLETTMGCFMVLAFIVAIAALVSCWVDNLKAEIIEEILEQLCCDEELDHGK